MEEVLESYEDDFESGSGKVPVKMNEVSDFGFEEKLVDEWEVALKK